MNKVQLLGTITKDIELKYTQSGGAIGSFGIAYNERYKSKAGGQVDKAMFFDVTAFGNTAENIQKFFHKGSRILIDGSLDFQQWEKDGQKRSKVGIKVNGFDFIDKKSDTNTSSGQNDNYQAPTQQGYSQPAQNQPQHTPPVIDVDDESIPF